MRSASLVFILFYDFLFKKLFRCSFPPDSGAPDVIHQEGEQKQYEGFPEEVDSYWSLISLLPAHTSDTGHVLGSLSSSGEVSKVFRYKTRRSVIANHSCIRIDISCLASTHSFIQQMFIEWLQYLRPCVKYFFPLFNFLYLFRCILKLLSFSSSFPQVPTNIISYWGDFVLEITLFDSRVDRRQGVIFPSLTRHWQLMLGMNRRGWTLAIDSLERERTGMKWPRCFGQCRSSELSIENAQESWWFLSLNQINQDLPLWLWSSQS